VKKGRDRWSIVDNFYEQLVTTQKTTKYKVANGAAYVFGVLAFLALGGASFVMGIIFLGMAVGLFFLKRNLYVEYEYGFTNGEIDIDKISEMTRRKRIFSFSVRDLELLAPEESYHVKDFSNKPEKIYSFFPGTSTEKVYVAMVTGGTDRAQVRFVPNNELIELCYKYNPRAVKKIV
jgi:hypothetical protein